MKDPRRLLAALITLVLVLAACTGSEASRITLPESSRCLGYLRDLAFVVQAMDPLVVEGEQQIRSVTQGDADGAAAAETLGNISASFAKLGRDLDGLGEPPAQLEETAGILDRALDRFSLAYERAEAAASEADLQELAAVQRTVAETIGLVGEASTNTSSCSD